MMMTETTPVAARPTHLSFPVTTIAKMVRKVLKRQFPTVKFSVRSDSYSMGSSVYIRTEDKTPNCPTYAALNTIAALFCTKGFDGMTDSTTYHPLDIDGMRISMNSYVSADRNGVTMEEGRVGVELTDADVDAIIAYRATLVREFASDAYRY